MNNKLRIIGIVFMICGSIIFNNGHIHSLVIGLCVFVVGLICFFVSK